MACWELGLQLKRDWLPELEKAGLKLMIVGIGSAESALTFAEQLELPANIVFADADAKSYQAMSFVNSDFQEDGGKRGMRMLTEKTGEAVKSRSNGRPVTFFGLFDIPNLFTNDDLEAAKEIYKPLMPTGDGAMDKTLVQGGVLVFRGPQQMYQHLDTSVGVHGELSKVLAAAALA
ncbi:unnamed protein product [Polarella glacialis]|uniref:Uncharacterized protein n=1 Tax=Polarella glacialis TaxID=89957 RepID=A0A813F489_POLGL|nr:unnamed protein product [Polarella glacialis]CAE8621131.1 unnamed protein product [Polarella glacialis]CAE8732291.1 unnamed protein product [Polarella glacialis]|mmetsp:Transcript_13208/g.20913  ORF Transcript_13208/g.20913 Transcript_13208/m.20913 type:complete len:176 (-) Transcript_13208:374-901(-)